MSKQARLPEKTGFIRTQSGEVVLRLGGKDAAALIALDACNSADFGVLAKAAKLNPKTDFIGRDLSGLPLGASKSDLRGFVFRDANLTGTGVRDALIDETTDFTNARLDEADAEAIQRRFPGPPPPDFDLKEVHAMILRGETPPKAWVPWIKFLNFGPIRFVGFDLPAKERLADVAPLAALTELQRLDLAGTQVSDLAPLAALNELRSLDLNGTHISDLTPLAALTELQRLDLAGTQVSDLAPLKGLTALKTLSLINTRVSDLAPLAALNELNSLDLNGTHISDLTPLAALTELQSLDLDNTELSNFTVLKEFKHLEIVWLNGTNFSDCSQLGSLANLYALGLNDTKVSDITPLAGFIRLKQLWLSNTIVSDLSPVADLPNLTDVRVESLGRARKLARTLGKAGVVTTKYRYQRFKPRIRPLAPRRIRSATKRPPSGM